MSERPERMEDSIWSARQADYDMKVRACWHYYIEGLTQERIATILGVTRLKVQRMLTSGREDGIIQFHIDSRPTHTIKLEKTMKEAFGLSSVFVVPNAADNATVPRVVGQATARYLERSISPGDTIAVTWGRTLRFAISDMPSRDIPETRVISLIGGVAKVQPLNPTESAWGLAEKIGAECFCLPAPIFADSPEDRNVIMEQKSIRDVIKRAEKSTVALLSVGALSRTGPLANFGFLRPSEFAELKEAGAVGDILCHFVDAEGRLVDHPLNRRLCAFPLPSLTSIPAIVLMSGGREKVPVIRATLKRLPVKVLITDEAAAESLLEAG